MRGALLLLVIGLIYLAPTVGRFSGFLDEGLVTSAADRVVQGELLYRDIYIYTTPGPVGYVALAFLLLGTSLETAHWALVALKLALLLALYWISRLLLGRSAWALAPPLAFMALAMDDPTSYQHHWIANLPFALSVALALEMVRAPRRLTAAALGASVVLTGLTLQTFGLAAALPAALALAYNRRCTPACLAGAALALGPFVLWLWGEGIMAQFLEDTVASNRHRSAYEFVPLPHFFRTLWLAHGPQAPWPQIVTGLVLVLTQVVGLVAPLLVRPRTVSLQVAWTATWAMFLAGTYRLLPSQLLLHGFLALVLTAWMLHRWGGRLPAAVLGLLLTALALQHYREALQARYPVSFPRGVAWVSSESEAHELRKLVRFIQRHAPAGCAFLAPYEPNLYFLMGLRNPTRYLQLRPLQYSRAQMEEVLATVGECPVFRFPAYETDAFLAWSWPSYPLDTYHAEDAWFYQQLERTHRREDYGAVQIYVAEPKGR